MVIGITIFCVVVAIFGYTRSKFFLNHITVMFLLWGIIVPISSLGLYGVTIPNTHTYVVILVGLIGFFLGGTLWWGPQRYKISIKSNINQRKYENHICDYKINKKFLCVLILISLIYYVYKLILIIELLRSGVNYAYIRNLVTSENENIMHNSRMILAIQTFIASPTAFLVIALMPIELLKKGNKDKVLIYLSSVMLFLWVITTGGRSVILWFALYFVCAFSMRRNESNKVEWRRIIRRYRFVVIIGAVLLFIFFLKMTLSRKGTEVDLLKEIYIYFVAPIPFLDHHLYNVDMNYTNVYGFGISSFYGLIYPILYVIRFVSGSYPSWITEIYYMSFRMLERGFDIGGHIWMNAFATAFFQPYIDGREAGVFVIMLIFGAMCAKTFYKARYTGDKKALLLYLLLLQKVMFSMVRFYFTMQAQAMCFLYAFFALIPVASTSIAESNKE